jgi:two-component system sensor histidine kinase KdpD
VYDLISSLDKRMDPTDAASAEMLYQFTLQASQLDLHREPGPQLTSLLQSIFCTEFAAIFDADLDQIYCVGNCPTDLDALIRTTYFFGSVTDEPEIGLTRRVLQIGSLPIGAMILRGEITPLTSSSLACLIAITFDRFHSLANVSKTESARRAEQLRTTVLDSLAHAYKTPLTAIRAATTGMHEMSGLSTAQSEMLQLIEEQTNLLSDLTTRLLKTAQVEARDLTLHTQKVIVASVIEDVLATLSDRLGAFSFRVVMQRDDMKLVCDRDLLIALLTQYVENALKYANPDSAITIQTIEHPSDIVFSVHSIGPVIPQADRERVFDRYFRCANSANEIPGTGIGLSIAKHATQAHGGDVWLTSDERQGTTFFASIPISLKEIPKR